MEVLDRNSIGLPRRQIAQPQRSLWRGILSIMRLISSCGDIERAFVGMTMSPGTTFEFIRIIARRHAG